MSKTAVYYSGGRPRIEFWRLFLYFFVLSSLLAAKRDKYMRRGLLARPGPSGNDICQSRLTAILLGDSLFLFRCVLVPQRATSSRSFPSSITIYDISLLSKLKQIGRAHNKKYG